MTSEKQRIIAKETTEIHAPIARRLGLNNINKELEELCFEILNLLILKPRLRYVPLLH
jgi:GTP pyrophosphokinase